MYDKYIKIDSEHYAIGNNDIYLIKTEKEEDIINILEIKNRLIELQEKLKINSIEKVHINNIETMRKHNVVDSISFHILAFLIFGGFIGILGFYFSLALLKVILISIIPCFFASVCIQRMFPTTDKKENLNKLLILEKEEEELTKEIEQLQDILSKLNLQKVNFKRFNTPIKPMKQSNTKHKPTVRKLTNNKTRNQ